MLPPSAKRETHRQRLIDEITEKQGHSLSKAQEIDVIKKVFDALEGVSNLHKAKYFGAGSLSRNPIAIYYAEKAHAENPMISIPCGYWQSYKTGKGLTKKVLILSTYLVRFQVISGCLK